MRPALRAGAAPPPLPAEFFRQEVVAAARALIGVKLIVAGVGGADSWAVDAHKWLNVPYDSGVAIVREPEAMHAAMGSSASYLVRSTGLRDGVDYVPEFSRRGRGVP